MTLRCEGFKDCTAPVTHVDRKGYVYCTAHGIARRSVHPCRKLLVRELRTLERGETIAWERKSAASVRGAWTCRACGRPGNLSYKCAACAAPLHEPAPILVRAATERVAALTNEQFDAGLCEAIADVFESGGAAAILAIPGVYEVLSEELNNEAIERALAAEVSRG